MKKKTLRLSGNMITAGGDPSEQSETAVTSQQPRLPVAAKVTRLSKQVGSSLMLDALLALEAGRRQKQLEDAKDLLEMLKEKLRPWTARIHEVISLFDSAPQWEFYYLGVGDHRPNAVLKGNLLPKTPEGVELLGLMKLVQRASDEVTRLENTQIDLKATGRYARAELLHHRQALKMRLGAGRVDALLSDNRIRDALSQVLATIETQDKKA